LQEISYTDAARLLIASTCGVIGTTGEQAVESGAICGARAACREKKAPALAGAWSGGGDQSW